MLDDYTFIFINNYSSTSIFQFYVSKQIRAKLYSLTSKVEGNLFTYVINLQNQICLWYFYKNQIIYCFNQMRNMLVLVFVSSLLLLTIRSCNSSPQQPIIRQRLSALSNNGSCLEDCCASLSTRAPTTYYYYQNTGRFKGGSGESAINVLAYSGQDAGYLNPDYQCKQGGPLPASTYEVAFCKNMMHQITQRPCSFYLKPLKPFEVCGRDDFFIHGCQCCTSGDDSDPPAAGCSAGCIVMSYKQRRKIRIGDKIIVSGYEPKLQNNESVQVASQ